VNRTHVRHEHIGGGPRGVPDGLEGGPTRVRSGTREGEHQKGGPGMVRFDPSLGPERGGTREELGVLEHVAVDEEQPRAVREALEAVEHHKGLCK
jgi:hypothetical protein